VDVAHGWRYAGCAVSTAHLGDGAYASLAGSEFNQITPENEMKWDATEPQSGNFTFGGGDAVVTFAQQHSMKVKGHAMVWHLQLPSWVQALSSASAVRAAMTAHIRGLATHYRGKVFAWDVVNEAIDDGYGYRLRDSVFRRALGDDYIAEAFRIAHEADPDALLFYNDYSIEGLGGKADAAFSLVKKLVSEGVPISGIGLQMHVNANGSPSGSDIAANIRRLAALGLLVNVSELDASVCSVTGSATVKLAAQRTRMHEIVAACVAESKCIGVTLWGVSDKYSWLNQYSPCKPGAGETGMPWGLPFDDKYAKKPAWDGMVDAFSRK
jgi:endo-1,4-beta-xylanase